MKKLTKSILMLSFIAFLFPACKTKPVGPEVKANYPDWAKNSVIYEVNVRQYTPEGTFKAFEANLPRLKELGVDILWFMPIHPIGIVDRKVPDGMKESLGSYYSVRDYKGVNPEFGTEADFKALVTKAHEMGFKVLIDWVANHSSRDISWIAEHPDWFVQDSTGKILAPFDWTDVAKLNYQNKDMRAAMIDAMKYWVSNCDIDGFRCDVAGEVPVDFWEDARFELEKTKPMFMLAENEDKAELCNKAFDANYGWGMHHVMHQVAQGKDSVNKISQQVIKMDSIMPKNSFQMNFITNHDENSWNGTVKEKFGDGGKAYAVLTYTLPGMPLIYGGQEAGLDKRLKFFTKDTISWDNMELVPFYQTLNKLKHGNEALFNPPFGGTFEKVKNSETSKVITFIRAKGSSKVLVMANLTNAPVSFTVNDAAAEGTFTDVFTNQALTIKKGEAVALEAFGYKVLEVK
jgi:glycosidase